MPQCTENHNEVNMVFRAQQKSHTRGDGSCSRSGGRNNIGTGLLCAGTAS